MFHISCFMKFYYLAAALPKFLNVELTLPHEKGRNQTPEKL